MESFRSKLRKTRRAIAGHGGVFIDETRSAGISFSTDTKRATEQLIGRIGKEGKSWRDYLTRRRQVGVAKGRELLTPVGFERGVLLRVTRSLELLQSKVHARLDALTKNKLEPAPPLTNYPKLTAKSILAQLGKLTDEECKVIYDYEDSHKRRATVLKAIEQRIAA